MEKIVEKVANRFDYSHPLVLVADISQAVLTTADDFKEITERVFFSCPPQYHAIYLLDWKNRLEPLYEAEC